MITTQRSSRAVKNVFASMFFRGGSILISLLLVPLTLSYLNQYEYGIWLTLSSVLTWVYVLDIGLGNGLRNKLSEALALDDKALAKTYVSTTFFALLFIIIGIYLLFAILQHWLDWSAILNVDPSKVGDLNSIVNIVFAFFCCNFVFKIVGNIYMAYQLSAINDLFTLLGNLLSIVLIYLCTIWTSGSLAKVAYIFSGAPVVVLLIAFPVTFLRYKEIAPSFSFVRLKYLKELMSLGGQFFIIQIACIILFMTSNLIISRLFGPEEVTPYNIAFKYFSLVTIGFTIIVTPIWSAITEAYTLGDMAWIRNITKKLLWIWLASVGITLIMLLCASPIYTWWVGEEIEIPFTLSLICGIYVCISNWNNVFSYIINGIGKIRLQLYSSVIASLLFIPLALILGRTWGIPGVVGAMCVCLLFSTVLLPVQFVYIIKNIHSKIFNN